MIMFEEEDIKIDLVKLESGRRLVRVSHLPTDLSYEKELEINEPVRPSVDKLKKDIVQKLQNKSSA